MIEVLTTDSQKLLHQLNTLLEQESRCQPKVCGLKLIESAHDNGLRMTARLRDFEVKDLLSLTQFFGFDTETFSLAVNLLDRFLSKMKVQAKHLGCVGLSCFYLAVKSIEEERNVPLPSVLALSIIALEIQALKYVELTEGIECIQKHSKINGRDLTFWQELVSKCLTEYSSNKCSKPNVQKLKWIVSGRTARQLWHSYYRITHLPTIPETAS
nr:cyclin-G1 [Peromyscus maniculatus bairdii]